ncbi:MAG: hypothetical protein H6751_13210 [Candidatus Omnitrophica bacterium]|nr:hypothetical protein [Candidatus Omnitrophota bacterium]MCB9783917.1 hypothetical protein [Candidatus Omnitrophota bacterium]
MVCLTMTPAQAEHDSSRWEDEIQFFEQTDKENPPPQNGILFIGSSSIRFWDVDAFFPNLPVINRGFGGSQIADSIHFADRILIPYHPKTVVFYAGDNDIAAGKSAEQVLEDYKTFAGIVRKNLPETRLIYIAIKPSLSRWNLVDEMRKANDLIEKEASQDNHQIFIDIDAPMIGEDGKPKKELFLEDGLHLNNKGYEIWSDLVREHLSE